MAFKPQNTIMLFTDGIEDHGVAKGVKWHALVWEYDEITSQGRFRWHFYGTEVPTPLPYIDQFPTATAMQHPETLFPPALNDLPDGDQGLYAIAMSVEYNRLSL